jgi:hypothetical protein
VSEKVLSLQQELKQEIDEKNTYKQNLKEAQEELEKMNTLGGIEEKKTSLIKIHKIHTGKLSH